MNKINFLNYSVKIINILLNILQQTPRNKTLTTERKGNTTKTLLFKNKIQ